MASHCCSLDPDETKRLEPGNLVKVGDRKLVKLAKMVHSIIYHTQFIWLGILLCFGSPRKMFREYSNDSSGFLPRFFLETHLPAPKSTSIAVKSGIFRVKFLPFRFPSLLQMNLFFTVSWFSFFLPLITSSALEDCLGRLPLIFCLQLLRCSGSHPGVLSNRLFFVEAPPPVSGGTFRGGRRVWRFIWWFTRMVSYGI